MIDVAFLPFPKRWVIFCGSIKKNLHSYSPHVWAHNTWAIKNNKEIGYYFGLKVRSGLIFVSPQVQYTVHF